MENEAQELIMSQGVLKTILASLDTEQVFPIEPQGTSMFPFFSGNRDTLYVKKPIFPLKRGDIALYRRVDGTHIVHRIHHICTTDENRTYFMLGDHQTWIEGPLQESQILGVVAYYIRKGKKIDCTKNLRYNLLWRIWMFLRPIRPIILRIRHLLYRILRKMKTIRK